MSNEQGQTERYNGMVKWFSNKLGYGFIKIVDDSSRRNEDIFVHQTRVTPNVSEYRTLRKGEYVSLEILPDEKRAWQANNVTGINGGPLMCDTYHRVKGSRPADDSDPANTEGSGN